MKTNTTSKTIDMAKVNAKSAKAAELAKNAKPVANKKPRVTKVVAKVEEVKEVAPAQSELERLNSELMDAQSKFEGAKSPNTKKKYAKLVETILDEMKAIQDAKKSSPVATTGSAPMTEKVRLADLPIGSCYRYRETGAIYKLLEVKGLMIKAEEGNGKTFEAKAANYKVFQVEAV